MQQYTAEADEQLRVTAQVSYVNGRVRLDGQISNIGKQPLENVKIEAKFDAAELHSVGPSGDTIHHLLPGSVYEVSMILEPRHSVVEQAILGLKVRSQLDGEQVKCVLMTDPMDVKAVGRSFTAKTSSPSSMTPKDIDEDTL